MDPYRKFRLMGKGIALVVTVLLALGLASATLAQPTGLAGRGTWINEDQCDFGCTLTLSALLRADGSETGSYRMLEGNVPGGFDDTGTIVEVHPAGTLFDYWCIIGESRMFPPGKWLFTIADLGDGRNSFDKAKAAFGALGASCATAGAFFPPQFNLNEGDFHAFP